MHATYYLRVTLFLQVVVGSATFFTGIVCKADSEFQVRPGQRQLFLDDVGIARIENLRRTMHSPKKKGAVIRPSWHGLDAQAKANGVNAIIRSAPVFDLDQQVFKIWLLDSTCFHSQDGLQWQRVGKPNLPVHKVVYDASDPDPGRRYKAFLPNRGFAVSTDGMMWKMLEIPSVSSGDESNFSFDSQQHLFIATVKHGGPHGRSVFITTSTDLKQWTTPELRFHADEMDQRLGRQNIADRLADPTLQPLYYKPNPAVYNVDVYNMGIFGYEGMFIGMPAMYHAVGKEPRYPNTEGFQLIQLACSRDLKKWKRLGDRRPFIGPSRVGSGAYDLTQIMPPSAPVLRGDELWFYYWGGKYRGGWKWVGPNGDWTTADGSWTDGYWTVEDDFDPDPDIGGVCLAVLRRDGFISLGAQEEAGSMSTKPFLAPRGKLHVNVGTRGGMLRVDALNADNKVVATSIDVVADSPQHELKWKMGDSARLTGQSVTLRFTLRSGQLYSYWFE